MASTTQIFCARSSGAPLRLPGAFPARMAERALPRGGCVAIGPSPRGFPTIRGAFLIVHLPSGLAVPARFDIPEQAASCLMEIVPLKDDWRELSPDDLARLKPLIIALVVKFGGWGMSTKRTGQIGPKRNGYGEVSP